MVRTISKKLLPRHLDIIEKREKDPTTWTFRALARYFNMPLSNVHDVYRLRMKYYEAKVKYDQAEKNKSR